MAERAPQYLRDPFRCPYCGVLAQQDWEELDFELAVAKCTNCEEVSIWHRKQLLVPAGAGLPLPSGDLPPALRDDYLEARDIARRSPRAAAALLRTLIEELVASLNVPGDRLYDRIGNLVKEGLDERVQQMLDTVRVIGNDAVHPGKLDNRDDARTAAMLLWLVNEITTEMITRPKRIAAAYSLVPETQRKQIERRDKSGANGC